MASPSPVPTSPEPRGAYRVRVWDNFHYMDDQEAYWVAEEFATADEAVARAREIVYRSCAEEDFDLDTYLGFGEDPAVIAPPHAPRVEFSARTYAEEICRCHHESRP